jgi:hypothetical protein
MQYNELLMRYEAYREKNDAELKHSYNLARWQAFVLLQPHIDTSKGNLKSPEDIFRFEWDKLPTAEIKELTAEQKQLLAKMDNAVFTNEADVFDELYNIGKKDGLNR